MAYLTSQTWLIQPTKTWFGRIDVKYYNLVPTWFGENRILTSVDEDSRIHIFYPGWTWMKIKNICNFKYFWCYFLCFLKTSKTGGNLMRVRCAAPWAHRFLCSGSDETIACVCANCGAHVFIYFHAKLCSHKSTFWFNWSIIHRSINSLGSYSRVQIPISQHCITQLDWSS